ncbi:hypothetical protein ABEB36_006365 [Hypothenemus hampei]
MVEVIGQPLHYYHYPQLHPYSIMEESSYPTITSPLSTQSDSDNSVSSIEVPSKSIEIPKKESSNRCLWLNCGSIFGTLPELAAHVTQSHSSGGSDGLYYCGWEGCTRNHKGFNARYKMLVHVRTHTNEKPHKCFQCDKSFSRAENLKIHTRSHSGEKPYVCPMAGCGKAYSNSSDRFKHTRTHSVDKPYQCKVPGCPKRYTDPSSLRKHVKTYKHYVQETVSMEEATTPERLVPNQIENHVPVIQTAMKSDRSERVVFGFVVDRKLYDLEKDDVTMMDEMTDDSHPLDLTVRKRYI